MSDPTDSRPGGGAGGGDRPPRRDDDRDGGGGGDRGGFGGGGGGDRGGFGGGGDDRGGFGGGGRPGGRGRDGDRERRPMTVKGRLRAKARKKARKVAKKKGGSFLRKKVCRFCADSNAEIDYKDPKGLRYFVTETGKLIPSRISGNCAKHQRAITTAIKRARQLALMAYSSQHGAV